MNRYGNDIVKPLYSEQEIAQCVSRLGQEITDFYKNSPESLVLVGVLKGSLIFLADLCREIDRPLEIEMIGVSSYGEATNSSGVVRITQDLTRPIFDKNVLLVEDIVDTGLTMKYLIENLYSRGPKTIRVCSLLRKKAREIYPVPIDFLGFEIPDEFVVGYGLDVSERLRNLPDIGILEHY